MEKLERFRWSDNQELQLFLFFLFRFVRFYKEENGEDLENENTKRGRETRSSQKWFNRTWREVDN